MAVLSQRFRARRILLPSTASALLLALAAGVKAAPRIADRLDMSSAADRSAHAVRMVEGAPCSERANAGTLTLAVAGARLIPTGSVQADLHARGASPYILQLTLATAPRDFGKLQAYRVSINGREVDAADETDPGAGTTRSLFLGVPGNERTIRVVVSAERRSAAPVIVSALKLYSGMGQRGTSTPRMGLALLTSRGSGYSTSAEEMRADYALIPRSPHLVGSAAVLYNFCVRNKAQNAAEIKRLAGLAEETGVPLRIAFQLHWAGIPGGVSDGAGGRFTDLPYQQITYDPSDQVDKPELKALMGERYDPHFGTTIPNRWGDTPWLTFNHPRLNQFRRIRLGWALDAWRSVREELAVKGNDNLLPAELSTGEETIYWAKGVDDSKYTAYNGGVPRTNLMADFNPFTVADALKDHVILDPRDGLDGRERWWLHQNLARQQQRIIDWMLEALPAAPVRLSRGQPVFATDLVRRNLYTEPYAMPCFPMKDASAFHPGLEVGYVHEGRSGGEYWSGATMQPWLLKEREHGRIALPNLECTGADDGQLVACLRAAYAYGARFATLYNWHHRTNTAQLLKTFANSIDAPGHAPDALDFGISGANPGMPLVSGTASRTYTASPAAFGINRVELARIDGGKTPAPVRVTLRAVDVPASVSVLADLLPTRSDLPQITTVLLPTLYSQQPGRKYTILVEPLGSVRPALLSDEDGLVAARLSADITAERERSVAIEDWQDAVDLIASLRTRGAQPLAATRALVQAEDEMQASLPQQAYRSAIAAEQLSLPALFEVPAGGTRLAPYFLSIQAQAPVHAVITEYSPQETTVSVRSEVAQTVQARFAGSEVSAQLTPGVPADLTLSRAIVRATRRPVAARPRGRGFRARSHRRARR